MNAGEKCTWVAYAYEKAPTFALSAGTDALGLATAGWTIHAMEYTTTTAAYSAALGSLPENTD